MLHQIAIEIWFMYLYEVGRGRGGEGEDRIWENVDDDTFNRTVFSLGHTEERREL
jgi:hypothetical protein